MIRLLSIFTRLPIAVFTLGSSVPALSDETLDTVSVTAQTSQTLSAHNFIGSHTSVDLEPYRNEFIELKDILYRQAGIDIQSVSGVGQYSTPIIRGAEGQQVLVFEDGVSINELNGSGADLSSVSLVNAGSINIYRGFVPMELSPTAIGGAIDIRSKNSRNHQGYAKLNYGSYGTKQLSVNQNFFNSLFSSNLNFDHLASDNDFIYEEAKPISSPSTPKNEARYNNDTRHTKIGSSLKYTINSNQDIHLKSSYKKNKRSIAGIINSPNNNTHLDNKQYSFIATHHYKHLTTTYTYKNNEEIYDDRGDKIGLDKQHNQYDSVFHKLNLTYRHKLNSADVIFNQQGQQEVVNSYHLNTPQSSQDNCIEIEKCDSEFTRQQFSTGVRLEWKINQKINSNLQLVQSQTDDKSNSNEKQKTFDHTSLFTGISYLLNDALALNTNYSQQVRIPSTNEMFGDRGSTIGNFELKPEESTSIEIGIENYNQYSHFSLYAYNREITDNISAEQDNRGTIRYNNIASTRYQGVEFNYDITLSQYLSFIGNLTHQKGIILDDNLASTIDKDVSNHRDFSVNQSIIFTWNNWLVNLSHSHQKGGYYTNQNDLPIPEKNQLDLAVSKQFRSTALSFKAINLTDQRVRIYPKSPVSGKTYYFTLNQKWDI